MQPTAGMEELLPQFQRLSLGVQKFLALYLLNGRDKIEACRISHPNCASPAVLACQILGRSRVRHILNICDQRSAVDATLLNVERMLKRIRRRGSNHADLIAPLNRIAKVLECIAIAKESDVA
jgi:hypothetical protein